jgi:hypothetical protein
MRVGRRGIVFVLIVALACSAGMRQLAQARRDAAHHNQIGASSGNVSLAGMNSYALALLLGGLRGPLVMFLWTSSEQQKSDRNLEDIDTKIEWIRLLQPEFDTVHVFQIWNKAFNLSAQMASLANKYTSVLDALDYSRGVQAQRPDDANLMFETAHVYFDKLANSSEQAYYRRRVRNETGPSMRIGVLVAQATAVQEAIRRLGIDDEAVRLTPDKNGLTTSVIGPKVFADPLHNALAKLPGITYAPVPPPTVRRSDPGWRAQQHEIVLDLDGNIRPEFIQPTWAEPARTAEGFYNGATLQPLEALGPFPYGLSPYGIAYNYYKRCQMLIQLGESPLYITDNIVDSRAGIGLEFWTHDEWEQACHAELRMLDKPREGDRWVMALAAAPLKWSDPVIATCARDEAAYEYKLVARLSTEAVGAFERHIRRFPQSEDTYTYHLLLMRAQTQMALADYDYISATGAGSATRAQLLAQAREAYTKAIQGYVLTILKFFTDDPILRQTLTEANVVAPGQVPKGTWKTNIETVVDPQIYDVLFKRAAQLQSSYFSLNGDQYKDERAELVSYMDRARARLLLLK